MNREQFAKAMIILASGFDAEISEQKMQLYYESLKDYSDEQFGTAAAKLVKTCKFFPKIADFVETIEGNPDDKASRVWQNYLNALQSPGPYKTLDMGDPIAHQALIDMDLWGMGIERNGYPDQRDNVDFIRRDFIARYKYHLKHSNPKFLPAYVPGIFETENRRKIAAGEDKNWTPGQIEMAQRTLQPIRPGLPQPAAGPLKVLPPPEKKDEE